MESKCIKKSKRIKGFSVIDPHTAGIDVGDREMVVAVGSEICEENVRTFGTFTSDYVTIAWWLKVCKITKVAMESTGIYWVQLYLLLLEEGFEVTLANAKHIKNVSGRKDDENDAMWIQRLHSCGLINGSFQPDLQTRALRDLMRHRRSLVQDQSRSLNRVVKALEMMNIKIHTVISDIDGKTGKAIIEAILAGERDAKQLARLADKRIKASPEILIKSLEGIWNMQQLFLLQQHYDMYNFIGKQIQQTDQMIDQQLSRLIASYNQGELPTIDKTLQRKASTRKNALPFHATAYLYTLLKTDLTKIPGINELTSLEFISETGIDMSKWPSSKHFASWLNIVPNTKISGGKIISSKVPKKKHRAGQALRMAASTLYHSKSPLGDFFRRKQAKGGPSKAILATATKIAGSIYCMIQNKAPYKPEKMAESQDNFKQAQIRKLESRLAKLRAAA